jgi:hypothetical protein
MLSVPAFILCPTSPSCKKENEIYVMESVTKKSGELNYLMKKYMYGKVMLKPSSVSIWKTPTCPLNIVMYGMDAYFFGDRFVGKDVDFRTFRPSSDLIRPDCPFKIPLKLFCCSGVSVGWDRQCLPSHQLLHLNSGQT